jgi:hypothetical protein
MIYPSNAFSKFFKIIQIRTIHMLLGYALIILSQVTILMGILAFNEETNDGTIGAINLGVFLGFWLLLEVALQLKMRLRPTQGPSY